MVLEEPALAIRVPAGVDIVEVGRQRELIRATAQWIAHAREIATASPQNLVRGAAPRSYEMADHPAGIVLCAQVGVPAAVKIGHEHPRLCGRVAEEEPLGVVSKDVMEGAGDDQQRALLAGIEVEGH